MADAPKKGAPTQNGASLTMTWDTGINGSFLMPHSDDGSPDHTRFVNATGQGQGDKIAASVSHAGQIGNLTVTGKVNEVLTLTTPPTPAPKAPTPGHHAKHGGSSAASKGSPAWGSLSTASVFGLYKFSSGADVMIGVDAGVEKVTVGWGPKTPQNVQEFKATLGAELPAGANRATGTITVAMPLLGGSKLNLGLTAPPGKPASFTGQVTDGPFYIKGGSDGTVGAGLNIRF